MINILKHISLPLTYRCTELSDKRILVTGSEFIKVFSFETYKELTHIVSEDENMESSVINDERSIFITTSSGLKQYSLPDLTLTKVYQPSSYGHSLTYLKTKSKIIFNDQSGLICLDMNSSMVIEFRDKHQSKVKNISSTKDDSFFFTTEWDKRLKKWSTDSLTVFKSVELESPGMSLLVREETGSILVGMANGSLAEYSIHDLSLIRTLPVHSKLISKIIQLSSGDIMTCSFDGYVCFPFNDKVQIKVSNKEVISITELSNKTIACCCRNGLKILPPIIFQDLSLVQRIDSISSSLYSIRKSTSDQKPQLISLLQHHLIQLLTPIKNQPEKFTGLSLSLLPDLKFIQRSHCFEGSTEGRSKILTQEYSLEMISSNSTVTDSQAILSIFDRKLRLLGRITKTKDSSVDFKVEKIKRGKWVFSMHDHISLNHSNISGSARVHFVNGYLDCHTFEGHLINRLEFRPSLYLDGVAIKVDSVGNDGMVATSDQRIYRLNFEANTIDECLMY